MSKHNPLVVSKVNQKTGKPYVCLFITDGDQDRHPEFVGSQDALRIGTALRSIGPDVLRVLDSFATTETIRVKDDTHLAVTYWEEKETYLLAFRTSADDYGKRFGHKKVKKLADMIRTHGYATVVEALSIVAGDAKPGEDRRSKGKSPSKGQEARQARPEARPESPLPNRPRTEPMVQEKPQPQPQPQPQPPTAAPTDRLARIETLESSVKGMMLVMERMLAELAELKGQDEPTPTPPAPSGPTGPKGQDKPQTPRKGGKGQDKPAYEVVCTQTIKGREYGYCSDGVTRVHVTPAGRKDYWRVQSGQNPVSIKPVVTSSTPRRADRPARGSRHLKLTSKTMFARPNVRKPHIIQPPAELIRLVAGR